MFLIGEIFVAYCNSENWQYILMIAVYLKSLKQIQFLSENLLIYANEGSAMLKKIFREKLIFKLMDLS